MVSPLHPGHPSVGLPPVYSPRNLAAPIATSMMASLTSISSRHTGQRYRYSSGGGPNGSSRASGGSGSWRLRRILPSPYCFQLIMDDAIGRVPDAPDPHVTVTVWTAQGVPTCALLVALAVRHRCHNLDRPFDDTLHHGPSLVNHVFHLGKCLGCLHAVIP